MDTDALLRKIDAVLTEAAASPLLIVEWTDTTNFAAWQTPAEVKQFATDGGWDCRNVGWRVYEDDDCIVLAARQSDDSEGHVGLAERIPKRAITNMYVLAERPAS